MSEDFTSQFKELAASVGADLVKIASIDRFEGISKQNHPASIFPEAKSVVVIAKRIVRGVLRGIEEGTQFDSYHLYGRTWLNNRNLAMSTLKVAEFLEENGWEAIPLPNIPFQMPTMGIPVREGQPAPNVLIDMDDAAVRAGMGEIGFCGMLLTPEFGPRQRLQAIITDAPLDADPILEDPICSGCKEHATYCPMGAINADSVKTICICGKEMPVASIDHSICKSCKNGACPSMFYPDGPADRNAAICTRSCIQFLEESGKVSNAFHNPFRQRPAWGFVTKETRLGAGEGN